MRADPGTYALLLRAEDEQAIEVGALGEMAVRPGVYVYVGSAFGPGGLRARVDRHVRGGGALHWHVDSLRAVTRLDAVWYTHDAERRECIWAEILRSLPEATVPLDGFGASDCNCPSHLVRFGSAPILPAFRKDLHTQHPGHTELSCLDASALTRLE